MFESKILQVNALIRNNTIFLVDTLVLDNVMLVVSIMIAANRIF